MNLEWILLMSRRSFIYIVSTYSWHRHYDWLRHVRYTEKGNSEGKFLSYNWYRSQKLSSGPFRKISCYLLNVPANTLELCTHCIWKQSWITADYNFVVRSLPNRLQGSLMATMTNRMSFADVIWYYPASMTCLSINSYSLPLINYTACPI